MKVYIICYIPVQIPELEESSSWDMGWNALSQSDCKISKPTISLDAIAWILTCWYEFSQNLKLT